MANRPSALWLLLALIVVTMLLGGGARDDVRSLLLLRPLTAVVFVAALALSFRAAWEAGRPLVILAGAGMASVLLQLIPLPAGLWSSLGGRGPVVAAYEAAGMALPALPLSLTPAATWNAAFALLTPVTALLLGLALDARGRLLVLRLIILIGLISGLIGMLQAIGSADGPLYFYRITNNGLAVGLFANRNHQAMLLAALFPMLAAHAALMARSASTRTRLVRPMTYAIWGFLVPLLLVTGSRAGLILGLLGLAASLLILRAAPSSALGSASPGGIRPEWMFGALGAAMLAGVIAVTFSRAAAVQRLLAGGDDELRLEALPTIWTAIQDFFPWGSGYGSFADVYRIYEPAQMLSANYLNHAHNDFAELLLAGGLPALVLMIAGLTLFAVGAWRTFRLPVSRGDDRAIWARMAFAVLLLLVLGSIADYPLRTPSLAVVAAVTIAIWARVLATSRGAIGDFTRSAQGTANIAVRDHPLPVG